jgi:hypothetical protein
MAWPLILPTEVLLRGPVLLESKIPLNCITKMSMSSPKIPAATLVVTLRTDFIIWQTPRSVTEGLKGP